MSDTPNPSDPQTGDGAVWGDEFVDTPENQPGDQEEPSAPEEHAPEP